MWILFNIILLFTICLYVHICDSFSISSRVLRYCFMHNVVGIKLASTLGLILRVST